MTAQRKQILNLSPNSLGEIRIPNKVMSSALSAKKVKALRVLATAKLYGHRACITQLCETLKMHPKTMQRQIETLVNDGMAGTDGKFLFPRAWNKLKINKRGGLYLTDAPKNLKRFEALCFAKGLKTIFSSKGSPQLLEKGKNMQAEFPATYLCLALGIKDRRFKALKADAKRFRFISVIPQFKILGKAREYLDLKKNLHGMPVFKRGKHTVVPDVSKIRVLI